MITLNFQKEHFVKYLRKKDLTWLASSIEKVKITYMSMQWQTFGNYTDCGIFLMRHMETYKGTKDNWITQLKADKVSLISEIYTTFTDLISS